MTLQAALAQEAVTLSKTERREYLVGVVAMLVLIVILVATALGNRGVHKTKATVFTLTVAFNRADGLHIGSPVRVAGMNIGTVTAATLDDQQRAVVTLSFSQPVALPNDTAAVIETDGMFGSKYVELRTGGSEDTLKAGDRMTYSQGAVIIEDLVALIVQRAQAARGIASAAPGETPAVPATDLHK